MFNAWKGKLRDKQQFRELLTVQTVTIAEDIHYSYNYSYKNVTSLD